MDGNQPTPTPERQPAPQSGGEQLSANKVEATNAPATAENKVNGPKSDDGAVAAQAQVAAVAADDNLAVAASTAPVQAPVTGLAADVDVIEPEWVKKAEDAVAKNREDPRAEEAAVEDLQREYLKARYDVDVKAGDEKP